MNEMESVREKIYLRVVIYLRLSNEDKDKTNKEESVNYDILNKVFVPVSKNITNRVLSYGHIKDTATGKVIDEVMCVFMKGQRGEMKK